MKRLLFLLILFTPIASADVVMITACDRPVLFVFDVDEDVYIRTPQQLSQESEVLEILGSEIKNGAFVIDIAKVAGITCPYSA